MCTRLAIAIALIITIFAALWFRSGATKGGFTPSMNWGPEDEAMLKHAMGDYVPNMRYGPDDEAIRKRAMGEHMTSAPPYGFVPSTQGGADARDALKRAMDVALARREKENMAPQSVGDIIRYFPPDNDTFYHYASGRGDSP